MEQHYQPGAPAPDGKQKHEGAADAAKKPLYKNKKFLLIIALVAVVLVGGGVAAALMNRNKKGNITENKNSQTQKLSSGPDQNDAFAQQFLQGCKNRSVSFTQFPVPVDQLGYIEPMGKMNDGHVTPTDHVYLAPKNMNAADNTTDVVMPADGVVTGVGAMPAQYIGDRNQQTAPEDHRLIIVHNCQYVSIFIHVHQLSDALKKAVGTLQPNENKQVSVELKAGDKLGKIGGNPVDWSLMDATRTLSGFITPSLYQSESWKVHVIDPIAVYSGDLKTQLIAKSQRSVEPYGGKIDYDMRGALVGNWFKEGTNGYQGANQERYWDGHLSVVPDPVDPSGTIVSIGNWQGKAAQFAVKGTVNPAKITKASGPTKYELTQVTYSANGQQSRPGTLTKGLKLDNSGAVKGTILFEVMDGEKLKVETFPGKTAAQVNGFTAAAQTYVR